MKIARPTVYGLISIVCPFAFGVAVEVYQQINNAEFWNSLGRDETSDMAGALFGFTEVIQFIGIVLLGCLFGLVFGAISLVKRRKVFSFGTIGVILNSLPFIALLALLLSKGS